MPILRLVSDIHSSAAFLIRQTSSYDILSVLILISCQYLVSDLYGSSYQFHCQTLTRRSDMNLGLTPQSRQTLDRAWLVVNELLSSHRRLLCTLLYVVVLL
ncbi:unnamed protein product, partial [Laminaria digitata]